MLVSLERTYTLAANLPWLQARPAAPERNDALDDLRKAVIQLREAKERPLVLDEDVSRLPRVPQKSDRLGNAIEGGTIMATLLNKTLGIVSFIPMLMSGGGMKTAPYMTRYNTTARTRDLVDRGYRLLFTPEVVRDLRTLQGARGVIPGTNIPSLIGKNVLTGAEILALSHQFDQFMSPNGNLKNWLSTLVSYEFVDREALKRSYTAGSTASYLKGGMMGGYDNAYYGVTQFNASTWQWVREFASKAGLQIGDRLSASFINQLIAAYVLGVLNQSLIRPYVSGELTVNQLYIAHNQGAGVFRAKRVSKKNFYAQSVRVQNIMRNELKFTIV